MADQARAKAVTLPDVAAAGFAAFYAAELPHTLLIVYAPARHRVAPTFRTGSMAQEGL